MALTGSLAIYKDSDSIFDTQSVTITYAADLHPDDADFDKRGTSEEKEELIPVKVIDETLPSSTYVYIESVSCYDQDNPDELDGSLWDKNNKQHLLDIAYCVYTSSEDRWEATISPYIKEILFSIPINLNDITSSYHEYAYDYIKNLQGFKNLTDDL